ncbi:hypothetical protein [Litorimonas sp. WD9-15]|uniref:hypothetical protein n=1 Tax=Litorimonas sp. WD9-15 TaxID=3418716 RepID=UPI003D05E4E3
MTTDLKIIRKLLLTISFLAIGLVTIDFVMSFINRSGRPFWLELNFYGLALALPLIGIWLAGRISRNDFLVSNFQQNLFRIFAVLSSLALAFQLVEAVGSLANGSGSIIQNVRFILTNSLLITLLAACTLWPMDTQTLETVEDIFE